MNRASLDRTVEGARRLRVESHADSVAARARGRNAGTYAPRHGRRNTRRDRPTSLAPNRYL